MRVIDRLLIASAFVFTVATPATAQRAHALVSVTVVASSATAELGAPREIENHSGFTAYEGRFGVRSDRPHAVAVRVTQPRPGVTVLLDDAEGGLTELGAAPVMLDPTAAAATADSIRCRLVGPEGASSDPVVLSVSVTHF